MTMTWNPVGVTWDLDPADFTNTSKAYLDYWLEMEIRDRWGLGEKARPPVCCYAPHIVALITKWRSNRCRDDLPLPSEAQLYLAVIDTLGDRNGLLTLNRVKWVVLDIAKVLRKQSKMVTVDHLYEWIIKASA